MQTTQAKQFLLESNFIKNIKKFSEKRLGVCKKNVQTFREFVHFLVIYVEEAN